MFDAQYAEVRVSEGAQVNPNAIMATCRPGDVIIAPPPSVGGHVTHHADGAAGLYALTTVPAPVDGGGYSIDAAALRELAHQVHPELIHGGRQPEPVPPPGHRSPADRRRRGCRVLFDAAHLCGMIAGRA